MSQEGLNPAHTSYSIPLPAEGFTPSTTRSRTGSSVTFELPPNCIEFYNDDEGYRDWRSANPDGWVMNNYRVYDGPIPAHKQDMENALTILHVTEKAHILNRSSTTRYRKLCCAERKPLEDFKRTIITGVIDA